MCTWTIWSSLLYVIYDVTLFFAYRTTHTLCCSPTPRLVFSFIPVVIWLIHMCYDSPLTSINIFSVRIIWRDNIIGAPISYNIQLLLTLSQTQSFGHFWWLTRKIYRSLDVCTYRHLVQSVVPKTSTNFHIFHCCHLLGTFYNYYYG